MFNDVVQFAGQEQNRINSGLVNGRAFRRASLHADTKSNTCHLTIFHVHNDGTVEQAISTVAYWEMDGKIHSTVIVHS